MAKARQIGQGRGKRKEATEKHVTASGYRADRLARDYPEIAARLAAGEFRSVAEAERAARGETPGLTTLKRGWANASAAERAAFRAQILIHEDNSTPDIQAQRSAPADSDALQSREWMTFLEADLHVTQVIGGWGADGLRRRIISRDVEMQDRVIASGEGTEIKPLTPEDFRRALFDDYYGRLRGSSGFDFLEGHITFLRRADVYRMWPPPKPRMVLPARPEGVDRKVWLVVTAVWALWGEGYRWPHQEALWLKVCERLGWDPKEDLSLPTLKTALAWLRKEDFIDL
jgi:hypothetical protein